MGRQSSVLHNGKKLPTALCHWKLSGCLYEAERFIRLTGGVAGYSGMMPKATAASMHRMEKPQT